MAIYAASDWHGQRQLATQILDYLKPNDTLYFLGDACDRGPYGWSIIKMLLKDPRVTYLQGNHEQFLINNVLFENKFRDYNLWMYNGGIATYEAAQREEPTVRKAIAEWLYNCPKRVDITTEKGNIILTHAGTDPGTTERYWMARGVKDPYIWNRDHLWSAWTGDDNTWVVHGHTPVEYTPGPEWMDESTPFIPEVTFYCDGHKIDIDMGSFYTGRAALLNLDTFEVKYFEASVEKESDENGRY